jgi:hypothetical protein
MLDEDQIPSFLNFVLNVGPHFIKRIYQKHNKRIDKIQKKSYTELGFLKTFNSSSLMINHF